MMKKIITILGLIIISFHSTLFAQNQKILLLGECDKESTTNMLNYLDKRANISLSVDNNITLSSNNISSYPIIFVCNNDYLKLNNDDASLLQNHLKQGGLLILDNITSDYTFSIFLNKILPQSKKKSLSLENVRQLAQWFYKNEKKDSLVQNLRITGVDIDSENNHIFETKFITNGNKKNT